MGPMVKPKPSPKRSKTARSDAGDPTQDVLIALRRIIRAVDLQSKRVAKVSGLTTPQVVILQAIRDLGEVTAVRIAEQVNLSPATVATIMERLEQRGFVERYRSNTDRRVVHSRLTAIGQKALKKAPPLLHEKFISSFSRRAPENQRMVIETLEDVAGMLGGGATEAAPIVDVSRRPGGQEK